MFDLEQSIAEWRRQMLSAGVKVLVLEELESHLREEFELQRRVGFDAPSAFDIAAKQIGKAPILKTEFAKIERYNMKLLFILLGIFGVLFGMALVLPAMAWFRNTHTVNADHLVPFVIGLLIVISGLGSGVYGLKKRKA